MVIGRSLHNTSSGSSRAAAGRGRTSTACPLRGVCTNAPRRPRGWARRCGRAFGVHDPVAHDLGPPLRVAVPGLARRVAERAAEAGLLLDLAQGGLLVALPGLGLALGEAPVVVARAVDEQDVASPSIGSGAGARCRRRRGPRRMRLHPPPQLLALRPLPDRPATARERPGRRSARWPRARRRRTPAAVAGSRAATRPRRPRPGARRARPGGRRSPWRTASPPCRPRARPPRRRTGTASPRMRTSWSSWSGGVGPSASTARRSFFHGLRTNRRARRSSSRSSRSSMTTSWTASANFGAATRRRAGRAARGSARSACRAAARRDPRRAARASLSSRRCAPSSMSASAARRGGASSRSSSTSVSRTSPRIAPSHFSSSRSGSLHSSSTSGAEGAQVGAQAAGGDPRLVHVSASLAETHARIVDEQPERSTWRSPPADLGRGGREVERRRRHDIGRIERARARARARSSAPGRVGRRRPSRSRARSAAPRLRRRPRRARPRARGSAPRGGCRRAPRPRRRRPRRSSLLRRRAARRACARC